jgi:hypothetical protein
VVKIPEASAVRGWPEADNLALGAFIFKENKKRRKEGKKTWQPPFFFFQRKWTEEN